MALRILKGAVGRMAGDSLILWLAQLLGVALSLVVTVFVTRALGPDGRGVYTWLLTLAAVGSHIAVFGLDTSSRRLAASEPEKLPELVRMNVLIIGLVGSAAALILGAVALPLQGSGHNALWMALAMASMPLNALSMSLGAIMIAQRKVKLVALQLILPKVVMAIVFGLLLWMAMVNIGNALMFNLLAVAVSAAWPLWWLRKALAKGRTLPLAPYVAGVWRTCSATYIAALSAYVMQKVDVLMVGYYMGSAPTGYFGVASNIVDLMITPVAVIAMLLAARLSAGDTNRAFLWCVLLGTMALSVLGSAFVYMIAPWLVPLLFGAAFEPSVPVLRLLCPAVVGLCAFILMNNMLMATGRARHLAVPAFVGALINIGLNVVLIPRYGLAGACWASIAAYWGAALCAGGMVGYRTFCGHGGWRIFFSR